MGPHLYERQTVFDEADLLGVDLVDVWHLHSQVVGGAALPGVLPDPAIGALSACVDSNFAQHCQLAAMLTYNHVSI